MGSSQSQCITFTGEYPFILIWISYLFHLIIRTLLQFPLTADYCQLHRDKRTIIPAGIQRGCPTSIDLGSLPWYEKHMIISFIRWLTIHLFHSRIQALHGHLMLVVSQSIPSDYLTMAQEKWHLLSRQKALSLFYEIGSFAVEQPG